MGDVRLVEVRPIDVRLEEEKIGSGTRLAEVPLQIAIQGEMKLSATMSTLGLYINSERLVS